MLARAQLPLPSLDALLLGAHRRFASHDPSGRVRQGAIPVRSDEGLYRACGVRIAFTEREGGVSSGPYAHLNCADHVGDDLRDVAENRRIVMRALGAEDAQLLVLNQVHGTRLVRVASHDSVGRALEQAKEGADAMVVGVPDVVGMLNSADCLLLALVAPDGSFALVHAGWRGAVAHVAAQSCKALEELSGMRAEGFNAYIGPHICASCFEVGQDVAERFSREFGEEVIVSERHVSLAKAVTKDLARAGMSFERIADVGECTMCNAERYFSYRAAKGVCGRVSAVCFRER